MVGWAQHGAIWQVWMSLLGESVRMEGYFWISRKSSGRRLRSGKPLRAGLDAIGLRVLRRLSKKAF